MDAGRLFVAKWTDLERYVDAPGDLEYNLIAASAILRHMLLEGLIEKVQALAGACPTFLVAEHLSMRQSAEMLPSGIDIWVRFVELRPALAPPHWTRRRLRMQHFLDLEVVHVRGEYFSVRSVVKLAANANGGVHLNAPRPDLAGLQVANDYIVVDGLPVTIDLLRAIATTVLEGTSALLPLLMPQPAPLSPDTPNPH